MYLMIMYSCFMFTMFLVSLFSAISFFYYSLDLVLEWLLYSTNSSMIEIFVLVDWISMLFSSVVLMISSLVILYSSEYMKDDSNMDRFVVLMMLFVVSMLLVILSPSLISVLFGWDLLGLVSYCLVIYYQNFSSYNSGMVTVLSNRVGDVGLLMAIGIAISHGSWNESALGKDWILVMLILLAGLTKSAQMPFSSWLPMAMAAPTPVSSLVHSSTLVTAGVYLFIRFNSFISGGGVNYILMTVAVGTMIMAGLMANFEFDLKKIIALSTLSQLGFMMVILSVGANLLGFYHLLTHAIFKSLLFMCAGSMIHMFKSGQDIRYYGNLSSSLPFLTVGFFVSILSLVGFPFMAGFYSKDFIMEMIYIQQVNLVLMVLIIVSVSLTVMYSLRVCYYLFYGSNKYSVLSGIAESGLMNFSMMMLMFLGVSVGSLLNWGFYFDFGGIFLGVHLKNIVVSAFLGGCLLGVILMKINFTIVKSGALFILSMWYLNFFYISSNKSVLNLGGHVFMVDQSWVEGVEGVVFFKLKFIIMKIYYSVFKIYNVIFNQILILLILFVFVNLAFSL